MAGKSQPGIMTHPSWIGYGHKMSAMKICAGNEFVVENYLPEIQAITYNQKICKSPLSLCDYGRLMKGES